MIEILLAISAVAPTMMTATKRKKKRALKYTITAYKPELHYERDFDPEKDAINVSIKKYFDNGGVQQNKTLKIRQNQGSGIKEFFYTYDNFVNLLEDMQGFEEEDLIPEFGRCHEFTTRRIWNRLVEQNGYGNNRDAFEQAIVDMTAELVPDPAAKETMLLAIEQGYFKKPREVDVLDHHHRFEILMEYVDKLPSETDFSFTDEQVRRYYGATFPEQWRAAYIQAGKKQKRTPYWECKTSCEYNNVLLMTLRRRGTRKVRKKDQKRRTKDKNINKKRRKKTNVTRSAPCTRTLTINGGIAVEIQGAKIT